MNSNDDTFLSFFRPLPEIDLSEVSSISVIQFYTSRCILECSCNSFWTCSLENVEYFLFIKNQFDISSLGNAKETIVVKIDFLCKIWVSECQEKDN